MEKDPNEVIDSSLEKPESTGVVEAPKTQTDSSFIDAAPAKETKTEVKISFFKKITQKINIYFLLLVVMLILIGGFTVFAIRSSQNGSNAVLTQELTQEDLKKLANTDATVGDAKQTLSIESNAIFSGKILVKSDVDIAGSLRIGGKLSLAGVDVGGTSALDQIQGKNLTITGDSSLQGKVTIQNGIVVTGSGSFSGSLTANELTVSTLRISNDLIISRHLGTGGNTPTKTNGSALGSGGTASINGTDTAGTITINTGSSAPAGCFLSITFAAGYSSTPRVIISPSSSAAGGLDYYTTRTTSGFSVCTASDPADSSSFVFDYFVIQ